MRVNAIGKTAEPGEPCDLNAASPHSLTREATRGSLLRDGPEPVSVFDKRATFLVVTLLLGACATGIWQATMLDLQQYTAAIAFMQKKVDAGACVENLMLLHVALTPFRSFALVRGAALFLSFSLVLIGSLLVMTGIKTAYRLNIDVPDRAKSTLEASSPGLLLIAAGAALMAAAIYRQASPTFKPMNCSRSVAEQSVRERLTEELQPSLTKE